MLLAELHMGGRKVGSRAIFIDPPDSQSGRRAGCPSVEQDQNQISLTEEGKSFLVDARRLLALSLESIEAIQRFSRGESASSGVVFGPLAAAAKADYWMRGIARTVPRLFSNISKHWKSTSLRPRIEA